MQQTVVMLSMIITAVNGLYRYAKTIIIRTTQLHSPSSMEPMLPVPTGAPPAGINSFFQLIFCPKLETLAQLGQFLLMIAQTQLMNSDSLHGCHLRPF